MNNFSIQYNEKRFTEAENKLIQTAVNFAQQQHDGQLRASGEPYFIHPLAVAQTVADWGLDAEAIAAALLHDVVEDTDTTLKQLAETFGQKVAELVDGVTKLRLSVSPRPAADSVRLEASNENLRKLLLATAKDVRVIVIKLADRLHNLRTLNHLPAAKRALIARESLQVYAPLADRLGMGQLKGELEDLGFKYALPDDYARLERLVRSTTKRAERYLMTLKREISEYVEGGGIVLVTIEARQKHLYSIHKKMQKVDGDIEKIYDLVAVRVIVASVADCYQVLGILHQHYKPLIYRIKDYVAVPKPNGYQSLHTTVFAQDGHITEIQIRTPQMHEAAEYGLAAHFYYDSQKTVAGYGKRQAVGPVPHNLRWVTQLRDLQQATGDGREFVEGVKLDLFADRIFVFSPKGDLYELPDGSTPLDFAFAVHSGVGLRALGSKVNGKMQPLDTKLENRDVVEIVTRREAAPSRDWLGIVVTGQAKNRIRSWFRTAGREINLATGRSTLETALHTWGVKRVEDLPKRAVADALDELHIKSLDDLLVILAEGGLTVPQVIRRLIPDAAKPPDAPVVKRPVATGRVLTEGKDLSYSLAACCQPVFPQPLLGYVTRGKGVTVHVLGCPNMPADTPRYAACRWEAADGPERLLCRIEVTAVNRIGLVRDVTAVVARQNFNINGLGTRHVQTDDPVGETVVGMGLEVPDLFALAEVLHQLSGLPSVRSVQRLP